MRITSLDPGVTTGFATWTGSHYHTFQVDTSELTEVWRYLDAEDPNQLVYEDFKHRPNLMKAELFSVEVIGVTKLYSAIYKIPIVAKYLPARAKAFWTNDKIKKLGLWKTNSQHSMDALRVLLTHRGIVDMEFNKEVFAILGDFDSGSSGHNG